MLAAGGESSRKRLNYADWQLAVDSRGTCASSQFRNCTCAISLAGMQVRLDEMLVRLQALFSARGIHGYRGVACAVSSTGS